MTKSRTHRLSRSQRLQYVISRLRVSQDITPQALARELNVSERTIYRDLSHLEASDTVKKHYSRAEGRYLLEAEIVLPAIQMTPSEALAISASIATPALAQDSMYAEDLRSGLHKIRTALTVGDHTAQEDPPHISFWPASLDGIHRPVRDRVAQAICTKRQIHILYWSVRTDQEQNLVVSPYELRMVHGEWYLLGYTSLCGQVRVFAVSRIRQLELSQQKFRMPRRHVMETHFAQAWKTFEDTEPFLPLKVRFAYSVADLVRQTRGTRFDSMELQPDGSLICTGKVASLREWTWWLLAFGPAAEVLAPQRLRAEMARSAQEMHLRYAELEGP